MDKRKVADTIWNFYNEDGWGYSDAERLADRILALFPPSVMDKQKELTETLLEAVSLIRTWHNFGMGTEEGAKMWKIYYNRAPEMNHIREALKEIENDG